MEARIAGIILCIIGLVLSAKPTLVWKLTKRWKTDDSKWTSIRYMKIIRIVSGASIGVGVLLAAGILK